jgi:prophage maintenance system killer protein
MAYRYLATDELVALQRLLGGSGDVRGETLERVAARPALAAHYDNADLIRQAALLMAGLVWERPFTAGNRRLALAAGDAFIVLNGFSLAADPLDLADQLVALARAATFDEAADTLDAWLRRRIRFDG